MRVGMTVAASLVALGIVVIVIAPDSLIRVAGSALFVLGTGRAVITYRRYRNSSRK